MQLAIDNRTSKGARGMSCSVKATDVCTDFSLTVGPDLKILDANAAAEKACGLTRGQLCGKMFCSQFTDPQGARDLHATAMKSGLAEERLLSLVTPEGTGSLLLCRATLQKTRPRQVQITGRDVTARKRIATTLFDSQEKFRIVFEFANIGMALVDLNGNILEVNQKACHLFGFTKQELEWMHLTDLSVLEDESPHGDCFKAVIDGGLLCAATCAVCEKRFRDKQGNLLFVEASYGLARSQSGEPQYVVASFRDVTERKLLEAKLEMQATTDLLTKTLNRVRLEERGKIELLRSDRYGHKLSLAMIDIDNFKGVNDTHGHAAGDTVLSGFAEVARGCLRLTDLFGRWGGEEFIVLLPDTGPAGAKRVSERLRKAIEAFSFPGGIRITASVGIVGHRKGEDFASLVARADAAMYHAKENGRNQVVIDIKDREMETAIKPVPTQVINLHWKAAYASGQATVDAEHHHLFEMTNRIIAAMASEEHETAILPLVRELIVHVQMHFLHEEELLTAVGYPQAAEHGEIHRKLVARAAEMSDQFERGIGPAGDLLGFLIHDVVARHMLIEDRKFFPWFKRTAALSRKKRHASRAPIA